MRQPVIIILMILLMYWCSCAFHPEPIPYKWITVKLERIEQHHRYNYETNEMTGTIKVGIWIDDENTEHEIPVLAYDEYVIGSTRLIPVRK